MDEGFFYEQTSNTSRFWFFSLIHWTMDLETGINLILEFHLINKKKNQPHFRQSVLSALLLQIIQISVYVQVLCMNRKKKWGGLGENHMGGSQGSPWWLVHSQLFMVKFQSCAISFSMMHSHKTSLPQLYPRRKAAAWVKWIHIKSQFSRKQQPFILKKHTKYSAFDFKAS